MKLLFYVVYNVTSKHPAHMEAFHFMAPKKTNKKTKQKGLVFFYEHFIHYDLHYNNTILWKK